MPQVLPGVLLSLVLALAPSLSFFSTENPFQESQPAQNLSEQSEITTQEQLQSFQVKVNLVEVRVVVHDQQGKAVGGLTQDDFLLLDDKKPQAITKFLVERSTTREALQAVGGAAEDIATEPHSRPVPHEFIAYLFDDLHLEPRHLSMARNAAMSALTSLTPSERLAIYTTSGQVELEFTDDRPKIEKALGQLNSKIDSRISDCPFISYYQADLIINKNDPDAYEAAVRDYIACTEMRDSTPAQAAAAISVAGTIVKALAGQVLDRGESQTKLALKSLNDVVRRLGVMPGARTIVVVSPGFLITEDRRTETDVLQRAVDSNVVVNSLDARGLYARDPAGDIATKKSASSASLVYENQLAAESASSNSEVLAEMADATGGRFVQNRNDLATGMKVLSTAPEYSYLLAFVPWSLKDDGKFHNLKVELKQHPGYTVQARKGYFAPFPGGSTEQIKREIAEAVFAQDEVHELPMRLQTQYFRDSDDSAKLLVLVHVDVRHMQFKKADGRNLNELTVVAALFDRNANFVTAKSSTVKMHIKDATLDTKLNSGITVKSNFDVKPGGYMIRVVARDEQGKMLTQNEVVDIR